MTRDLLMAARLRRHGANSSLRIIWEARAARIPLSWALALCEQEGEFQNIFGADKGGPYPHQRVTKKRVQALIAHVRAGGTSNGVGFTQLTYLPFILDAERQGGAHIVKYQLRVGFKLLRDLSREHGWDGVWRYNGAPSYQALIRAKQQKWHQIVSPTKGK